MAINSIGYPKTIASGEDYARIQRLAGMRYAAAGHGDLLVTKAGTGTRQANIAAGRGMGKSVLVHNTAGTSLNLPAPSGSSQWHCVVLNRWVDNPDPDPDAVPYISTLSSVAGTASKAIPALTTSNGGSLDQDPLALCRVTSDSTLIQEVVDLRLISPEGLGFYIAHSELAMKRLDDTPGAEVYRTDDSSFYRRVISPTGGASWDKAGMPKANLSYNSFVDGNAFPGWAMSVNQRLVYDGTFVWVHIEVTKSGGQIIASSSGTIPGHTDILNVNPEWRPKAPVSGSGYVTSDASAERDAGVRMNANGRVQFTSTQPGATIRTLTADFFYAP